MPAVGRELYHFVGALNPVNANVCIDKFWHLGSIGVINWQAGQRNAGSPCIDVVFLLAIERWVPGFSKTTTRRSHRWRRRKVGCGLDDCGRYDLYVIASTINANFILCQP